VARGAWMFLINNDAVAAPDTIERLMAFAAERPEAGMLACRVMRYEQPHFFDSVGLLLYPDGVCRSRGWEEKDIGQYDRPEEVLAPHGCAGAYRKAMIDEVGPFHETYFAYLEDLDLGMRGQLAGWRCWYVPDADIRHHKSSTFGNYSKFKAYHVERNRIWNAVKLLPRFILLVSPLFTLNRYLLQGYAAATHQGLPSDFVKEYSYPQLAVLLVRAYTAALMRLPEMLGKRREISRRRRISTAEWYQLISRFKLDAIELALKH
jgi:GT2 family glycosyltransferase